MNSGFYLALALATGLAQAEDKAGTPPAKAAVAVSADAIVMETGQAGKFKPVEIQMMAPTANDPKTICKKAMVGKGQLANQEFTFVLDGSKPDGDLETLKVIAAGQEASETKLDKLGPEAYALQELVFLPGTGMACERIMCNLKAPKAKITCYRLIKVLKAKCDLAGKSCDVVVSDSNRNGKLGDPWILPRDPAGFLSSNGSMKMGDMASVADVPVVLGTPFLKDGAQWELKIVDGKPVVKKQDVPMGSIVWKGPSKGIVLILMGKQMMLEFQNVEKDGWIVPAGDYRMVMLAYQQDKSQVMVRRDDKVAPITVQAGKPLELVPVTEVVSRIKAEPMTPQRDLVLSLSTSAPDGSQVAITPLSEEGKTPKAPGFRVLDAAGKEVATGSFEYG